MATTASTPPSSPSPPFSRLRHCSVSEVMCCVLELNEARKGYVFVGGREVEERSCGTKKAIKLASGEALNGPVKVVAV